MATTLKQFDCVAFKEQLQSRLLEEYQGLNDEEIQRRRDSKLQDPSHPVARLWMQRTKADIQSPKVPDER